MKIKHPWKCDICGTPKQETNHWFLGVTHSHLGVEIVHWEEVAADTPTVAHICGLECAAKWLVQTMSKEMLCPKGLNST